MRNALLFALGITVSVLLLWAGLSEPPAEPRPLKLISPSEAAERRAAVVMEPSDTVPAATMSVTLPPASPPLPSALNAPVVSGGRVIHQDAAGEDAPENPYATTRMALLSATAGVSEEDIREHRRAKFQSYVENVHRISPPVFSAQPVDDAAGEISGAENPYQQLLGTGLSGPPSEEELLAESERRRAKFASYVANAAASVNQ